MTAADRRVLTLGPAPRQGNTDKVLEWQWWQGEQGMPHSWAPGPRAPLRSNRRQAVQPVAQDMAWELTWVPLYTGQPPQSSLFSPDSIIPKNK